MSSIAAYNQDTYPETIWVVMQEDVLQKHPWSSASRVQVLCYTCSPTGRTDAAKMMDQYAMLFYEKMVRQHGDTNNDTYSYARAHDEFMHDDKQPFWYFHNAESIHDSDEYKRFPGALRLMRMSLMAPSDLSDEDALAMPIFDETPIDRRRLGFHIRYWRGDALANPTEYQLDFEQIREIRIYQVVPNPDRDTDDTTSNLVLFHTRFTFCHVPLSLANFQRKTTETDLLLEASLRNPEELLQRDAAFVKTASSSDDDDDDNDDNDDDDDDDDDDDNKEDNA